MKNIYLITIVTAILCGTSCSESLPGTNVISGRLLNNCEDQEPVANQLLYFYVDYDTPDKERIAYTDGNGRFEYSFEGPVQSESALGGTIRITESRIILAEVGGFANKVDAGDIYLSTPSNVQMTFQIKGQGFKPGDSLFIDKGYPLNFPTFKIPYPFDKTVLDTVWPRFATTSAGTMENYSNMNKPEVKRLNGTFGSLCYWQVKRDGKVIKLSGSEVTFGSCTTKATMLIDLNKQ